MAVRSSSKEQAFGRHPDAPAASISCTERRSSPAEKAMILVVGCSRTIWRVASTPFKFGMVTSIMMTSGLSSEPAAPPPAPILRLSHDLHVCLPVQTRADGFPQEPVVIRNKYSDPHDSFSTPILLYPPDHPELRSSRTGSAEKSLQVPVEREGIPVPNLESGQLVQAVRPRYADGVRRNAAGQTESASPPGSSQVSVV